MKGSNKLDEVKTRLLNKRLLGKLVVIAFMMFGFGYALIPLYEKICEITGINVLTTKDDKVVDAQKILPDRTRSVTVEFDANATGPWRFRPTKKNVVIHPGELTTVVYEVVNKEARSITAQAIPSYAPVEVGQYVKKMECFCFQQQVLKANEAKQMTVAFYIDPALPKNISTITLSYTFFELEGTGSK